MLIWVAVVFLVYCVLERGFAGRPQPRVLTWPLRVVALGLDMHSAAIYTFCTAIGEFFYHHQYGYHKNNYGDIVWWDMLFGSYENPQQIGCRCGFDDAKEQRLLDMLRFRDVHRGTDDPRAV